jgi:hypothetical protein
VVGEETVVDDTVTVGNPVIVEVAAVTELVEAKDEASNSAKPSL